MEHFVIVKTFDNIPYYYCGKDKYGQAKWRWNFYSLSKTDYTRIYKSKAKAESVVRTIPTSDISSISIKNIEK